MGAEVVQERPVATPGYERPVRMAVHRTPHPTRR